MSIRKNKINFNGSLNVSSSCIEDMQKNIVLRTGIDRRFVNLLFIKNGNVIATISDEVTIEVICARIGYSEEYVTLKIRLNDSVAQLKDAIRTKCSFSIEGCKEILRFHRKELENDKLLKYYDIEGGSTLCYHIDGPYIPRGKLIKILIRNIEYMTLYIFEVGQEDTVATIKEMCKCKTGNCTGNIVLEHRGFKLEDDDTLMYYEIEDGDTLILVNILTGGGYAMYKVPIIGPNGTFNLTELQVDTIGDIRKRIETQEGYSMNEYNLIIDDRILDDDTRYDWSMKVFRVQKIIRTVNIDGSFELEINDHNKTVSDIKRMITQRFGLFEHLQILSFNGRILNNKDTVCSCLIGQHNSDVTMTCQIIMPEL